MFDINSRMEQWSAANRAQHTEELKKSIQEASAAEVTMPLTRSAALKKRATPFIKPRGPRFDINGRIDSWNRTEKALDSEIHRDLTSTDPFKRNDEPSEMAQMLMNAPPEVIMDMIERCVEKLESMNSDMPDSDAPDKADEIEEAPKDEKPEVPEKPEEPKETESDEKDDDKEDSSE